MSPRWQRETLQGDDAVVIPIRDGAVARGGAQAQREAVAPFIEPYPDPAVDEKWRALQGRHRPVVGGLGEFRARFGNTVGSVDMDAAVVRARAAALGLVVPRPGDLFGAVTDAYGRGERFGATPVAWRPR